MSISVQEILRPDKKHRLPMAILGGDLSADGNQLFAGCMDGLYQLDLQSGQETKLDSHKSYISSVCLGKENQIVSAGYDGAIQWFDLEKRERIRRVQAHQFWSWQMAISPDRKLLATVTGQYLAGNYEYAPAPESEPSIKILNSESSEVVAQLPHVPPVQCVAFSPDGQRIAAGNLMGEVRVYEIAEKKLVAQWQTPDFTSWGIIKSHCNIGGIYDIQFAPDSKSVLVVGMGNMRDPMAGNGRQLWQRFDWQANPAKKLDETHKGDSGEGLMETLAIHPQGEHFLMAGRLRGGAWNAGLFEMGSGKLVQSLKTGFRITHAVFSSDGKRLILLGGQGQPKIKSGNAGKSPKFGRVDTFKVSLNQ